MRLVVAEKPSVAKSIAAVLGANEKNDGYLEGNGYIVSWCFGHLAGLATAEAYSEKYAKWRREDLPILPEKFQYTIGKDKRDQFNLLKKLMAREDVNEVVNACDAGREGELIFRTVYQLAGCKKPMLRLWISSMEDSAIAEGFNNLRPGSEYDNLYASALCRSKADWLVGINATRLFSVLYNRTLNVGRVVSPTLAMLVQREAQISAFQPETFYTVEISMDGFSAKSERIAAKADTEKLSGKAKNAAATVKSVTSKKKTEKPPTLYDLTTLQRDANRILGFTAQQTLDYLQSLYEKKLCTYPRTDSRYLTDDMTGAMVAVVAAAEFITGKRAPKIPLVEQVCDSKRVTDHHAIIPTSATVNTDLSALPAGERAVLDLVAMQVLIATSEAYSYTETNAVLECAGAEFKTSGRIVTNPGWKIYAKQEKQSKTLPALIEGQILNCAAVSVNEGKTTPPKHFTEDTLLASMENASSEEMPDDAERKGLGTPATRAAILEKLVSTGFVERKKAKKAVTLIPSDIGASLITVLPEQLQSPLLTAEWEHQLGQIQRGELSAEKFLSDISAMVSELVKSYEPVKGSEVLFPSGKPVVGKCPRCGSDVTESKKGFFCENRDCRFALWKDNKYLSAKKLTLTKKMVEALLKSGRTLVSGIYSEKTGKTYDAFLTLRDDGSRSVYGIEFQ